MPIKKMRDYDSYDGYINHQAEKSKKKYRRQRLLDGFTKKKDWFVEKFKPLKDFVKDGKVLCLGARMGEEVVAFKELGYNAIGIDIVPYLPYVIEGDFNNILFPDETFDLIYSNSLDHALDETQFLKEAISKLKTGGYIVLYVKSLSRNEKCFAFGTYEVLILTKKNVIAALKSFSSIEFVGFFNGSTFISKKV